MPREFSRTDRLGDAIQRELAQLLQFELRDPRVGLVSITGVEVSRDLSHAKVFVTALDDDAEQAAQAVAALNGAAGFLRSQLARVLTSRTTPKLRFLYDDSSARGQRLSQLIDQAVAADRAQHDHDGDREE